MGQPVVHFEVTGKDGKALSGFFSELFGWKIDANNPMGYGIVDRDPEDIADPRHTRPPLCEFANLTAPLRRPGPSLHHMRG